MSEKTYSHGAIQDADGVMTAHMHPPGETLGNFGDQQDGEPCVWCERGIPRYDAVKRTIEGNRVTVTEVKTGRVISVAEV